MNYLENSGPKSGAFAILYSAAVWLFAVLGFAVLSRALAAPIRPWRMIDVKLNYVKLAFNSGRTSGLVHNPSLVSLARTPLEFLIVFRA